jgi:pectinesterase
MKTPFVFLLVVAFAVIAASAADKLCITVTQDLSIARPAETITIPWSEVNNALPGARLQCIVVKDAAGLSLPYQVTNIDPVAKDPKGVGIAYGELIFQHDFAADEKTATFTVEKIDAVAPVFPAKAFARYIPERLDDFAWENDKVAHRTYGAALEAPAAAGSGKEVLRSSGLDVWCKRVGYPIVDRWYNKGHDHYHHDEGEGLDMYQVGPSRGCGGTGVWDGTELYVSHNYKTWKILANGPIRSVFELAYDTWDAHGVKVSEIKRFTVDAGHYLDQVESTFVFEGGSSEMTVAIGLNKNSGDKGQDVKAVLTQNKAQGWLAQWEEEKTNGSLGEAILVVPAVLKGFAEDVSNRLILVSVISGLPLRYYVGAGWSKSGDFSSKEDWNSYVAACAARAASPVKVSLSSR